MSEWIPDDAPTGGHGDAQPVVVLTEAPFALHLERIVHPRATPAMAAFGTFVMLGDERRVIAQTELPPRVLDALLASQLFATPRFLLLRAREAPPGIVAEIAALLPEQELQAWMSTLAEESAPEEPWKASVPAPPSFESGAAAVEAGERAPLIPFALGVLHRYAVNREHPDDLTRETVALFGAVLGGAAVNTDAKQIDNLLGGL